MSQDTWYIDKIWSFTPSSDITIPDSSIEPINDKDITFKLVHENDSYFLVFLNIEQPKIQVTKKENRNVFESTEIFTSDIKKNLSQNKDSEKLENVKKNIDIFSYKIFLKFTKSALSPVSTLYIKRNATDKLFLSIPLENVTLVS